MTLWHKLALACLFQLGWLGAVVGGNAWGLGLMLVMLWGYWRYFARRWQAWLLVGLVAASGCFIDSVWLATGVLISADAEARLPVWLACLWVMFATTLSHLFSWLHRRLILASVLGAVIGPLSYWSGTQLGPMQLGQPLVVSVLLMGMAWAVALPTFMMGARYVVAETQPAGPA